MVVPSDVLSDIRHQIDKGFDLSPAHAAILFEHIDALTTALAAERELTAALDDVLVLYRTGTMTDVSAKIDRLARARERAGGRKVTNGPPA